MTLFRLILLRVPDGFEIESFRNIGFDCKTSKDEGKNLLCKISFTSHWLNKTVYIDTEATLLLYNKWSQL